MGVCPILEVRAMDTQYTEQELYKFLDLMRDRGLMKSPTVHSRKIAAQKILGVCPG